MKKNFLAVALLATGIIYAQDGRVGINTTTPQATLDIVGKPSVPTSVDGIIAPRLTGAELNAKDAVYTSAQTGALVYATSAAPNSGKTTKVTSVGYYYFDGTEWVKVGSGSGTGTSSVTADNGLNMSTTSNVQLGGTLLKNTDVALGNFNMTFNTTGTGNVGIGTNAPTQKLHIVGQQLIQNASGAAPLVNISTSTPALFSRMLLTNTTASDGQTVGQISFNTNNTGASIRANKVSGNAQSLIFATRTDGDVLSDRMIINQLGNVGIGTAPSPTQKLDVDGNVRFRQVPLATGTNIKADDKMMVLDADGTAKLYPLPATIKKVSPEQTGNFTFTASDDWDVILYNKDAGANAVLTLPVTGVAPGKTVYVTNVGLGAIDVPSSIMRAAPPSPNIGGGASVTFVFLGPNGGNKWAQVSGF